MLMGVERLTDLELYRLPTSGPTTAVSSNISDSGAIVSDREATDKGAADLDVCPPSPLRVEVIRVPGYRLRKVLPRINARAALAWSERSIGEKNRANSVGTQTISLASQTSSPASQSISHVLHSISLAPPDLGTALLAETLRNLCVNLEALPMTSFAAWIGNHVDFLRLADTSFLSSRVRMSRIFSYRMIDHNKCLSGAVKKLASLRDHINSHLENSSLQSASGTTLGAGTSPVANTSSVPGPAPVSNPGQTKELSLADANLTLTGVFVADIILNELLFLGHLEPLTNQILNINAAIQQLNIQYIGNYSRDCMLAVVSVYATKYIIPLYSFLLDVSCRL